MSTKFFQIALILGVLCFSCSEAKLTVNTEVSGVQDPVISLNGSWKFNMTPPDKFWKSDVDFSAWDNIEVPGECQMQGFAIKHDQPYVYKKEFAIPKDFEGKEIQLNFYGVYSYARVWVNGQFVREHYGGFTKWTCDISSFIKAGENAILTVEIVDRADDVSYGSGYAKHQIGGILRDIVLTALPKTHFQKLHFETLLDDNYQDTELKINYKLSTNSASEIKVELFDAQNKLAGKLNESEPGQLGELTLNVKNPLKWDAEHPNLYTVVTSLMEDGKEILKTSEKIGFREVVVDGNKLLVNGKSVKLRGACRHDIHPTLGRMTTAEYDLKDVLLAKECNMNFIRTSHYPPSEKFLDYCDEYGIYVEDETAVCFVGSHRTEAYKASGASQTDPEFTGRYLSQLEEMVQNHRNHPSIIIWSIGNENSFGNNFVESYKWVKANDTSRPVIYSYPGQVPDSLQIFEIASMHYPDWQGNLEQYGIKSNKFGYEEMPMLYDEWAHVACYNNPTLQYDPNVRNFWGQSLDSMWTNVFNSDGGLGGAIWCMLDETFMLPEELEGFNEWWGILDKNVIPSTYLGPCVGYGEWGIIDTWRRKKPEFWTTKKAYSPTKILKKEDDNFKSGEEIILPVQNRFDHTNFSELKILWKYGNQSGEIRNTNIEPHNYGELIIPANNWDCDTKLNIQFFQNDTSLVDEYNIQLGAKKIELPSVSSGNIKMEELNNSVTFSGKNFTVELNKQSGLLQNLISGTDTLLKSGPHVNLKIQGKRVQYSTIEMDDYATNWKSSKLSHEIEDGILNIYTEGTYDSISTSFHIQIDEEGVLLVNYKLTEIPEGKGVQESGIKFIAGNQFNQLAWNRESYFTAYPEGDIGSSQGIVDLNNKPPMKYREPLNHNWELDTKGYYYHGLDVELPYANIVRSLKENIFSYQLATQSSNIRVLNDGKQACRFDKIDGENILLINDQWDYSSLLWGNYMKQIKSEKESEGNVILLCN